jgi:hypothetical protein
MSAAHNADVHVKVVIARRPEQRAKSTGGTFTFAKAREGAGEAARFWTLFVYSESARAEIDRLERQVPGKGRE